MGENSMRISFELRPKLEIEKPWYRIGRADVTANSNMRPPFSEVKTCPGNHYLP